MGEINAPLPSLAAQIQCLVEEKYGGKQAALALAVGVSEATVHRWSTGFIESPHPAQRAKLQALGIQFPDRQLAAGIEEELAIFAEGEES